LDPGTTKNIQKRSTAPKQTTHHICGKRGARTKEDRGREDKSPRFGQGPKFLTSARKKKALRNIKKNGRGKRGKRKGKNWIGGEGSNGASGLQNHNSSEKKSGKEEKMRLKTTSLGGKIGGTKNLWKKRPQILNGDPTTSSERLRKIVGKNTKARLEKKGPRSTGRIREHKRLSPYTSVSFLNKAWNRNLRNSPIKKGKEGEEEKGRKKRNQTEFGNNLSKRRVKGSKVGKKNQVEKDEKIASDHKKFLN